jgi:hypothetical protein
MLYPDALGDRKKQFCQLYFGSRSITSIWLGARKSERIMSANISINTSGITQPSIKPAPPDAGHQ